MDLLITPEDVRPMIRDVAAVRVGKRRTDLEDVTRILYEFGCCSSRFAITLSRLAEAAAPPCPLLSEPAAHRLAEVRAEIRRLEEMGFARLSEINRPGRTDRYYQRLRALLAESDELTRPQWEWQAAIDNAGETWRVDHSAALMAICQEEAAALLAARQVAA